LAKVFTIALLLSGLVIAAITPPFQAADELCHFLRAFQLSSGELLSKKEGTYTGGRLPVTVASDAEPFMGQAFHSEIAITPHDWELRFEASHEQGFNKVQTVAFVNFSNTALYSPVPYLPQTLAIFIGRALHLRTVSLLYLARIFVAVGSSAILYAAFRLLSFSHRFSWFLFIFASTPMYLFLMVTCSADSVTNSLAVLVAALTLHLKRVWSKKVFIGFLIASAALSLCKSVYFVIPWILLPVAFKQPRRFKKMGLIIACSALPTMFWSSLIKALYSPARTDIVVNPGLQVRFILDHPLHAVRIFIHGFRTGWIDRFYEMTGRLGWLDTPIPSKILWAQAIAVLGISLIGVQTERVEELSAVASKARLINSIVAAMSFFLIYLAMYLSWNTIGGEYIEGVTGRYFLALLPLLFLLLPALITTTQKKYFKVEALGWFWWVTLTCATWHTILSRYWR
jgi:uncharacterized membrane protein